MAEHIEDGGPAFPQVGEEYRHDLDRWGYSVTDRGLSVRDYFAAKAMQALITKSDGQSKTGGAKGVPLIAQYSYEFADALIKARAA